MTPQKFARFILCTALFTSASGCVFDPSQVPDFKVPSAGNDQRIDNQSNDPDEVDFDGDSETDESAVDFDGNSITDQPVSAPAPEPAVDPCPDGVSVSLDVKIHTFLVNGHPNGFAVDGMFEWNANGADDLSVDIQFKTNATDWVSVASNLPSVDVTTVDLSKYAGPSSSWHFRAAARAPGCSKPVAFSSITTIQN